MAVTIGEMTMGDYDEVLVLWQASEGIGLSDADSREGIASFLTRNPGLSLVARDGEILVGAVLCGHDGRRGYLHHLAVAAAHRGRAIGRALARECLDRLRKRGIQKCHLFVFRDNRQALAFWERTGWSIRTDLTMMSNSTASNG
jgi:ribosomal protein S18 acetylase RimI-like enzyme